MGVPGEYPGVRGQSSQVQVELEDLEQVEQGLQVVDVVVEFKGHHHRHLLHRSPRHHRRHLSCAC